MGNVIDFHYLPKTDSSSRLIIYKESFLESITAFSVNKKLAEQIIQVPMARRTLRLEKCCENILDQLPENSIIKDIDVLFNPVYKVDVIKMLVSVYKKKKYSLIWPGSYADGKLIYSEEGYPDYRVYEIKNYDIMYVI